MDVTSSISEFIDDAVANSIFGIELDADVEFKEEFVNNSRKIFSVSDPNALTSLRFGKYVFSFCHGGFPCFFLFVNKKLTFCFVLF